MLAQKVDKGTNTRAHRSVAKVNLTEGQLYPQTNVRNELHELTARP